MKEGQRDKALDLVKQWLEEKTQGYLKISDPYFSLDDLELLQMILTVKPDLRVFVLTSLKEQEQSLNSYGGNVQEAYRSHWRLNISSQDPPDSEIVIIGTRTKHEFPIHDRWWFTDGEGVRMGTSFRSLGVNQVSEFTPLRSLEVRELERVVDGYLTRATRSHNGEKILYSSFNL